MAKLTGLYLPTVPAALTWFCTLSTQKYPTAVMSSLRRISFFMCLQCLKSREEVWSSEGEGESIGGEGESIGGEREE